MTAVLERPDVSPPADDSPPTHKRARRARRPVRWSPFALAGLLVATAALYLWNLSASGYGNTFYAAAAWAGCPLKVIVSHRVASVPCATRSR